MGTQAKKKASADAQAKKTVAKENAPKPLTAQQQRFVDEYLVDLNATKAAIRAGYSPKTAGSQAFDLLKKPEIQISVEAGMKAREKRTHITQDMVLRELAKVAFFDIRRLFNADGTLKRPDELDDDAACVLASVEVVEKQKQTSLDEDEHGNPVIVNVPVYTKKAKVFDKMAALTLAARHLGMLNDKLSVQNPDGSPLSGVLMVPAAPSAEDWARAAAQVSAEQKAPTKH